MRQLGGGKSLVIPLILCLIISHNFKTDQVTLVNHEKKITYQYKYVLGKLILETEPFFLKFT